jgi:hypothetical protein
MTIGCEFLYPFTGRGKSGDYHINFVCRYANTYLMDNHRAALWCWLQHLPEGEKCNLIHIDQHTDSLQLQSIVDEAFPEDLRMLTLENYLTRTCTYRGHCTVPAIRWDNFLSFFLMRYSNQIGKLVMATHGIGDSPKYPHEDLAIEQLPSALPKLLANKYWSDGFEHEWIVDIDLDYFFCTSSDENADKRFLSDEYVIDIFSQLAKANNEGSIKAITIALSPSCCGGWENAECLCAEICSILKLPFQLPD